MDTMAEPQGHLSIKEDDDASSSGDEDEVQVLEGPELAFSNDSAVAAPMYAGSSSATTTPLAPASTLSSPFAAAASPRGRRSMRQGDYSSAVVMDSLGNLTGTAQRSGSTRTQADYSTSAGADPTAMASSAGDYAAASTGDLTMYANSSGQVDPSGMYADYSGSDPAMPPLGGDPRVQNADYHNAPRVNTSHVNGVGIWRSWERSFRHPLDALLDLVDNAVDADHGKGKIRMMNLDYANSEKNEKPGILLMNSSAKMKPMKEILEVFSSNKDKEAVGENGVGVKQASASLAELSFAITRSGNDSVEIGVLCKHFQEGSGVVLPSYNLHPSRLEQDIDAYMQSDPSFAQSLALFGGMDIKHNDVATMGEDMALGKARLSRIIGHMIGNSWKQFPHVFCLVLARLSEKISSAGALLKELEDVVPKTYIHLMPNANFHIQGHSLAFQYWERRLVALTYFPVYIDRSRSVFDMANQVWDQPPTKYRQADMMRVFVGFDPLRAGGSGESEARMYIYTREVGRLVKVNDDVRSLLKLSAGSTDFCQGLTILVDDFHSTLPLTPTKQDISWADAEKGDLLKANFYAWIRAVVFTYWNYYFNGVHKSKGALTTAVLRHQEKVKTLIKANTELFCPMQQSDEVTRFDNIMWIRRKKKDSGTITPKLAKCIVVRDGPATRIPFGPFPPAPVLKEPPAPTPREMDLEAQHLAAVAKKRASQTAQHYFDLTGPSAERALQLNGHATMAETDNSNGMSTLRPNKRSRDDDDDDDPLYHLPFEPLAVETSQQSTASAQVRELQATLKDLEEKFEKTEKKNSLLRATVRQRDDEWQRKLGQWKSAYKKADIDRRASMESEKGWREKVLQLREEVDRLRNQAQQNGNHGGNSAEMEQLREENAKLQRDNAAMKKYLEDKNAELAEMDKSCEAATDRYEELVAAQGSAASPPRQNEAAQGNAASPPRQNEAGEGDAVEVVSDESLTVFV